MVSVWPVKKPGAEREPLNLGVREWRSQGTAPVSEIPNLST
jgi:hypothetical protein